MLGSLEGPRKGRDEREGGNTTRLYYALIAQTDQTSAWKPPPLVDAYTLLANRFIVKGKSCLIQDEHEPRSVPRAR